MVATSASAEGVPSSALLSRPLPLDELEVEAAETDGEGEGGTEGDCGAWAIEFLEEDESIVEDRGDVRVRETITRSETVLLR